jgi:hypothetical protein
MREAGNKKGSDIATSERTTAQTGYFLPFE